MCNVLLQRKFDEVRVIQVLNVSCHVHFTHSSHVERQNDTTKNCFGIIKNYMTRDNERTDRDFAMSQKIRNLIFHFLSEQFYFVW